MNFESENERSYDPWAILHERELGKRWNKSIRTLQRWRAEGYGPPYILIGGTIHYRFGDIVAFENRMRRGG